MRKYAGNRLRKRDILAIVCLVLVGIALRLIGLREELTNLLLDEGAYLTAMQIQASGKAFIYKDIIFGHPPLMTWIGAALWNPFKGNLFALRSLYALLCMIGFAPVFAIVRRLRGTSAALWTLAFLCLLPAFANWLGRNVFLELPQNLVLFAAFWLMLVWQRKPTTAAFFGGLLSALSFLIKETAIPLAVTAMIALFLAQKTQRLVSGTENSSDLSQPPAFFAREFEPESADTQRIAPHAFVLFGLGFVVGMAGVLLALARIPNCLATFASFYSLGRNANDAYDFWEHGYELLNGFYAAPMVVTFGVLGTFKMIRQKRSGFELFLAWFSLITAVLLLVIPHRFYWRYWTPCLTIWSMGVWVWFADWKERRNRLTLRIEGIFFVLMGILSLAGLIVFRTTQKQMPETHRFALKVLERCPEPLFALDPIWNAATDKMPPLWEHYGGDVHGRQRAMLANPEAVNRVVFSCPTVVLDHESSYWMTAEFAKFLRENYKTVSVQGKPTDTDYVVVLLRSDFKTKPFESSP